MGQTGRFCILPVAFPNFGPALKAGCSAAVPMYLTELDTLVQFCFGNEHQKSSYQSPSTTLSVILDYTSAFCSCSTDSFYLRAFLAESGICSGGFFHQPFEQCGFAHSLSLAVPDHKTRFMTF